MSGSTPYSQINSLDPAPQDAHSHADSGLPPSPIQSHDSGTHTNLSSSEKVSATHLKPPGQGDQERNMQQPSSAISTVRHFPALKVTEPHAQPTVNHHHAPGDEEKMQFSPRNPPEDLFDLHDRIISRRVFVDNELGRSTEKLGSIVDTISGFVEQANALVVPLTKLLDVQEKADSLRRSWTGVSEKVLQFSAQSLNLHEQARELILLETKLLRKEKQFFRRPQDLPAESSSGAEKDDHHEETDSSFSGSEAHFENPVVQQYYSSLQEVNRLRDALINHEAGHARLKDIRDRKAAEGRPIVPSELEFARKYLQRRRSMMSSFSAANKEMGQLWAQCIDQRLEVEQPNYPYFDDNDILNELIRPPQHFIANAALGGNTDSINDPSTLADNSDTESRITSWLDQVNSEQSDLVSSALRIRPNEAPTNSHLHGTPTSESAEVSS